MAPKHQDKKIIYGYCRFIPDLAVVIIEMILTYFLNSNYFEHNLRMMINRYQWRLAATKRPYLTSSKFQSLQFHFVLNSIAKPTAWLGIYVDLGFSEKIKREQWYGCCGYRYQANNKRKLKLSQSPGKFIGKQRHQKYHWKPGVSISIIVQNDGIVLIKDHHRKTIVLTKAFPKSFRLFRLYCVLGPETGIYLQHITTK